MVKLTELVIALVVGVVVNSILFAISFSSGIAWFGPGFIRAMSSDFRVSWPLALGIASFAGMFYTHRKEEDSVAVMAVNRTVQLLFCLLFMFIWSRFL